MTSSTRSGAEPESTPGVTELPLLERRQDRTLLERLTLKRLLGMRKGSHRERVARLWRLRTILLACGVVNLLTACARVAMGEEPNGLGLIGLLLLITTLPQRKALKRLIRRGDLPERKAAAATR